MSDKENGFLARFGHWWMRYGKALEMALRGTGRDNISMMASGMVYSTLIAIIPCLTFLFAFLSAFGVLQPFMELIALIAEDTFGENTGHELMRYIEQFSSNAMSLGVIGLVSFIFTGILGSIPHIVQILNEVSDGLPVIHRIQSIRQLPDICLAAGSRPSNLLNGSL